MKLRIAGLIVLVFAAPVAAQTARLVIAPTRPQPGAVVRLTLVGSSADPITSVSGAMEKEPLHFASSGSSTWHAIAGIPVDAIGTQVAEATIRYASGKTERVTGRVSLPKIPPPTNQPLAVDDRFTKPIDPATQARIDRENAEAREIGRRAHDSPPMWTASFLKPRTSVITSPFGSGRLFNGSLTARHLGVDFRGAMGEPVRVTNRGVVALVDNFFLAGNVVYVDHGGGLVTAYFHLSKTLVKAGDTVSRGQVIGLVGNTGRVTGPHLHWAARYGEITVNPLDLLAIPKTWFPTHTVASSARRPMIAPARAPRSVPKRG